MTLSGSSAYKAEDGRKDERVRDRSPLRLDDRRESSNYSQNESRKQKLAFGFGKKPTSTDQRKGIQIKFGAPSVNFYSYYNIKKVFLGYLIKIEKNNKL